MTRSRSQTIHSIFRRLRGGATGVLVRGLAVVVTTIQLCLRNAFSRAAVTGDARCVVSLASHGPRTRSAFLAVESITRGSVRPVRLILWLDEQDAGEPLPRTLRRLQARGLEIGYVDAGLGPHKKYYPYVASAQGPALTLVTADDDVLYPRHWLRGLDRATSSFTCDDIVCYRAYVVGTDGGTIARYAEWTSCTTSTPSVRHFATGVSGVAYPPAFQERLRSAGTVFRELCPRADDVWLHVTALRGGFQVRQVSGERQNFRQIPGSQVVSLARHNVDDGGNDAQIRATYTREDQAILTGRELAGQVPRVK